MDVARCEGIKDLLSFEIKNNIAGINSGWSVQKGYSIMFGQLGWQLMGTNWQEEIRGWENCILYWTLTA